jgi:hypothetical protein
VLLLLAHQRRQGVPQGGATKDPAREEGVRPTEQVAVVLRRVVHVEPFVHETLPVGSADQHAQDLPLADRILCGQCFHDEPKRPDAVALALQATAQTSRRSCERSVRLHRNRPAEHARTHAYARTHAPVYLPKPEASVATAQTGGHLSGKIVRVPVAELWLQPAPV